MHINKLINDTKFALVEIELAIYNESVDPDKSIISPFLLERRAYTQGKLDAYTIVEYTSK
jgi:hypothetical protein